MHEIPTLKMVTTSWARVPALVDAMCTPEMVHKQAIATSLRAMVGMPLSTYGSVKIG